MAYMQAQPEFEGANDGSDGMIGALEPQEAGKPDEGPTMMSREARQLILSRDGSGGLQLWKVHTRLA